MRKPLGGRASDLICKAIMQNNGSATVEQGIEIHRFLFGYTLSKTIQAYDKAVRAGYIVLTGDVYTLSQETADAYASLTPLQIKRVALDAKNAPHVYVGEIVHPRENYAFNPAQGRNVPTYRVTRDDVPPLDPKCNGRSDRSKEVLIRGAA